MKTLKDYLNMQEQYSKELKEVREKMNGFTSWSEKRMQEYADLSARETVLKIAMQVNRDNLRRAYAENALPSLYTVLKKYNGKPCGEKTRQKISADMLSACGMRAYFHNEYRSVKISLSTDNRDLSYDDLVLYPGMDKETTDYKNVLTEQNKVNAENIKTYSLWYCKPYHENPIEQAEKIIKKAAEHNKMIEELNASYSEFLNMVPSKMRTGAADHRVSF